MQTFQIPSDRADKNLILRGVGPAMHVKTSDTSKMFVITKNRTHAVKMSGSTNIKFAA